MADDVTLNLLPGLCQPALVAQFRTQTADKSEAEFARDLGDLARIPTPAGRDFLVDLLIDLDGGDQAARALLALPVVAQTLVEEEACKNACLRLLVNRRFALAVRLMKELKRSRAPSAVLDEWLAVSLRYHYRHCCAVDVAAAPNDQLYRLQRAAGDIADHPEQLGLHDLVEPRLDPAFHAVGTQYRSETIATSPPWSADHDGTLQPIVCEPCEQQSQGFALLRNAAIIGCRSTIFFGVDQAIDDPLCNMSADEFSPFGIESAYIDVVYGLLADHAGRRMIVARRPTPTGFIQRGIFLNGPYQYNYFHWLAEYLSQVAYINEQAAYADWPLLIGEEALAHPNHIELLQRLAGPQQRSIIALRKDVAFEVGELLLPPKIARVTLCHTRVDSRPEDYAFAPDAIRRLRQTLALPARTPTRKLYLDRKRGDRLLNHDAIRTEFCRAGFEAVFPEDLTFEQARKLFAEASILAGPTGAAFTNLILCSPGLTAIVMTTDRGSRAGFFSALAGPLEQRVIYLHGPGRDPEHTLSPFEIAPEDVRSVLARLDADTGPRERQERP